jgi:hypothetical protein
LTDRCSEGVSVGQKDILQGLNQKAVMLGNLRPEAVCQQHVGELLTYGQYRGSASAGLLEPLTFYTQSINY